MEINIKSPITAKKAAEYLGVSRQRIHQLLAKGKIGNLKTGINLEELELYEQTRTIGRPEGSYKNE